MQHTMNLIGLMAATTPKNRKRWRLYVWGQPKSHLMDWLGCNYRVALFVGGPGPQQPREGFESKDAAEAWAKQHYPFHESVEAVVKKHIGEGAHMGDRFHQERNLHDIILPHDEVVCAQRRARFKRREAMLSQAEIDAEVDVSKGNP